MYKIYKKKWSIISFACITQQLLYSWLKNHHQIFTKYKSQLSIKQNIRVCRKIFQFYFEKLM